MDTTTRRALIGGAGMIGVAIVGQIVVDASATSAPAFGSPEFRATMKANKAAVDRFLGLPETFERDDPQGYQCEVERMCAASRAADHATPSTWAEFVELFGHQCDGGLSALDDDNATRLLAHAKRLLNAGA